VAKRDSVTDSTIREQALYQDAAGNYTEAIAIWNRLLKKFPKSPVAIDAPYYKASAFLSDSKPDSAMRGFEQTVKSKSENAPRAEVALGLLLCRQGKLKEGCARFKSALNQKDETVRAEASAFLFRNYLELRDTNQAVVYGRLLLENYKRALVLENLTDEDRALLASYKSADSKSEIVKEGPFYIQLGAFQSKENAQKLILTLSPRTKSKKLEISVQERKNGQLFLVLVNGFGDSEAAKVFAENELKLPATSFKILK